MFGKRGFYLIAAALVTLIQTPTMIYPGNCSAGDLRAWGDRGWGVYGDGLPWQRSTPQPVLGLEPGAFASLSVGNSSTILALPDGTLRAWGWDYWGQLGDGQAGPDKAVAITPSVDSVRSVAMGEFFGMALKIDGTVWSWGHNSYGQLGNGTFNNSAAPVQVIDSQDPSGLLQNVTMIAAGSRTAYALKSDGTLWSWGDSATGQLGANTYTKSSVPVRVQMPPSATSPIVALASFGQHALALLQDGTVYGWGQNDYGQTGAGGISNRVVPAKVWIDSVVKIAAGLQHSMAIKSDGTLWGWGYGAHGEVGNGIFGAYNQLPVQVLDHDPNDLVAYFQDAATVVCGAYFTLALKSDGSLYAWGDGQYGKLGVPATDNRSYILHTPRKIEGFPSLTALAAGYNHSLGLGSDGVLYAWGSTDYGALGDGIFRKTLWPVEGADLPGVVNIEAGQYFSLAHRDDDTVWTWGWNEFGKLGTGTIIESSYLPLQVIDQHDSTGYLHAAAVSAGPLFSLALKADGTVWAWGHNYDGCLGDGTTTDSNSPIQVRDPGDPSGYLTGVVAVDAGAAHGVALKADESVWAWGTNRAGQLGADSTAISIPYPVQVRKAGQTSPAYLDGVVSIATQSDHTLALRSDGSVWAWGNNKQGQLGDGGYWGTSYLRAAWPVAAGTTTPLGNVVKIAANDCGGAAIKSDGSLWAWGRTSDISPTGFPDPKFLPKQVYQGSSWYNQFMSNAVLLGTNRYNMYVGKSDGSLWKWEFYFSSPEKFEAYQVPDPANPTGYFHGAKDVAGASHAFVLALLAHHTITSSAGANGTITPQGATDATGGSSLTYQITPAPCYAVAEVLVDGIPVGARDSYTFENVNADHSISVSFARLNYDITATAGTGGTVSPAGSTPVACGDSLPVAVSPAACHDIADVAVDGVAVGARESHTFENVHADHTLFASFALRTYTITASAGTGGTISAPGDTTVGCGGSATYAITPAADYRIADVLVDGTSVGEVSTYTFSDVHASHSIVASFAKVSALAVLAPNGGEVVPSGGTYAIRWQAPSAMVKFKLFYSLDNGVTYSTIATVTGSSYTWSVPKPRANSPLCLIKIAGLDAKGKTLGTDTSDRTFTIEVVRVRTPDGGESLESGAVFAITWTTNKTAKTVSKVALSFSADGGGTWSSITSLKSNTGTFSWLVPAVSTSRGRVKVELFDGAASQGADTSDADFSIAP